jgi:hypothetical protein
MQNATCVQESPLDTAFIAIGANLLSGASVEGGYNVRDTDFYSFRVYAGNLTEEQVLHNAELDKKRFIAPPTVTIGGNSCTNVVVQSPEKLTCVVPVGALGAKDVSVTAYSKTNELLAGYTYRNLACDEDTDMCISNISPSVGPSFGGPYIKIIGNNFGEGAENISNVTIGGETCAKTDEDVTNSVTQYYCILPEVDISENQFVDVVVTATDGEVYTLNRSFEYKAVSREPISAQIE